MSSELSGLYTDILADQTVIWSSPIYTFRRHKAAWLGSIGITAALFAVDKRLTAALPDTPREIAISRWASRIGTIYVAGAAILGLYAAGRLLHHPRARHLGVLSLRTVCDAELLGNPLKIVTQRPRPRDKGGSGRFLAGGYGFPSGHSMKSWALASVVAREFPHRPAVGVLAYGLAATVSLARIFGFRHFASDAFAGAVMGRYIGAFVALNIRAKR